MPGYQTGDWDNVAKTWSNTFHSAGPLAEHKRKTYLDLINRWSDIERSGVILKTDLFDEAFSGEPFLFDIARLNSNIIAMDISPEIVARARDNALKHGLDINRYLPADVRHLPLPSGCVDLIISDSTLDHFSREEEIVLALKELSRVLRSGGALIITLDNEQNLTYPPFFLFRLWMKLGLAPYYIGRTLSHKKLKSTLENSGMEVVASTAIFHYPHPDGLVRWMEHTLRKLGAGKLDGGVKSFLFRLNRLENMPTRYWTGRYIAVKAVKK
jgi:SAM-dependent methyltransferase